MESLHLSRPHAIMMVGLPGSGKTFFASQFAETFRAPYIDSLAIERLSLDAAAAGELIGIVLAELAKTKQSFIFEGNSDARVHRTEFARWARSKGYEPMLIWVQTDQREALKRTLKNNSMTAEAFDVALSRFSAPHADEKPVVISGRHTYASQARVILAHLSKSARPEQPVTTPRVVASQPGARRNITIR